MKPRVKPNNGAFTIVETLIVLSIAAIIIIIVLLAVPALQRTTRNTDIKNDAAAIVAAIDDYESNNGQILPFAVTEKPTTNGIIGFCSYSVYESSPSVPGPPPEPHSCIPPYGATATIQGGDIVYVAENIPGEGGFNQSWVGINPTWNNVPFSASNLVGPNYMYIHIGYQCPTTTAPVGSSPAETSSPTQVAVYYPDETSSSSGNVLCMQA